MADELRKGREIDVARVTDTKKEVSSRDNDVIAGDDDLAERKADNVRVPGDVEPASPRRSEDMKED